ncbi:hypothetical protein D3C78_817900 [compost metagenome]
MTSIQKAGWNFDNSYARLSGAFYTKQNAAPVRSPELTILNEQLAASLGLDAKALRSSEGTAVFAGNMIPEGAEPLAQAYAGHQFGHFTMLGDGRALLLGEQLAPSGQRFDVQLKGAGATPYSRGGDGRAALGPMLREYIISEGMYGLGIATTRSLAVVTTGEEIIRETMLPGAVLTRIASSHIRVGTFQYIANWGSSEELRMLADYTIQRHYPEIDMDEDRRYLSLLKSVIKRQAGLIAKWQLVGFIHGVMNTDNMAISGETIDYGPCAFMDTYDPTTVFSSIDHQGRYSYGNQPNIGAWNLARFAEALLPLIDDDINHAIVLAEEAISDFADQFHHNWLNGMRAKLGINTEEEQDEELVQDLLRLMQHSKADYTNTFVALTHNKLEDLPMFGSAEFEQWREQWHARLSRQQGAEAAAAQLMRSSNPAIIPRNHRVEEALEAAVKDGDYSVMEQLLNVLANPYEHSPGQAKYSAAPEPSDCAYRTFCGT